MLFYIQIYLLMETNYIIYEMLMYSLICILKSHFCIILVYLIRKNNSTELCGIFRVTPCRTATRNFAMRKKNFVRVRTQPKTASVRFGPSLLIFRNNREFLALVRFYILKYLTM